jgi:uncharacterized protein
MRKKTLLAIAILVLSFIYVQTSFCQAEELPAYSGYVNDYADILSYETETTLSALASELEQKTSAQVAVVTIGTTAPLDIETYAVNLFEKWGIGQKGKDNGVLLLVAINDRAVRIEVGYGLEGAIPDALAKVIIEEYIVPSFKQGDFNTGIIKGAAGIAKLIAKEYNVELTELENLKTDILMPEAPSIFNFLFTLFIIIIFISLRMGFFWWWLLLPRTHRRRNGYWYGGGFGGNSGGFGGGFGGFGGGMSGGGGATGRW